VVRSRRMVMWRVPATSGVWFVHDCVDGVLQEKLHDGVQAVRLLDREVFRQNLPDGVHSISLETPEIQNQIPQQASAA
jgi:hypothetical protein